MKRIDSFRLRAATFLLPALLCLVPACLQAQNPRLDLSNLDKLSEKATEVNDVTLDGSLLQLATGPMKLAASQNADAAQAIGFLKDVKGIYVKNFKFSQTNQYSQADVDYVLKQLAAPGTGWNRIVENRNKATGEINEVYLMKEGDNVGGMVVISAEPKELSVVNIVGAVDLAKLAKLSGSLGIPKLPPPASPTPPRTPPPPPSTPDKTPAVPNDKAAGGGGSSQKPPGQLKAPPAAGTVR